MSKKHTVVVSLALIVGVFLGGIVINQAKANEGEANSFGSGRGGMIEEYLTDEEKEQIKNEFQERHELMAEVDREAIKTDEGIQVNLKGQDQETVDKMHQLYDENGGTWGKWKGGHMGGRFGKYFVDEDGNGVCDRME